MFDSFGRPTNSLTTTCVDDVQATVLEHLVSLTDSGIKPEEIKAIVLDFTEAIAAAGEDAVSVLYDKKFYGEWKGEGLIWPPQV